MTRNPLSSAFIGVHPWSFQFDCGVQVETNVTGNRPARREEPRITMKKTMTAKQIEANRRNAQKSTGPRTDAGRAVSRLNALKHGILSTQVLVRGRHGKENAREFKALHARFHEELQPHGPVEEMLVDQIVTAHWRLRRALAAEAGAIALGVDDGKWNRTWGTNPQLRWMQWEVLGDPIYGMETSAMGNRLLETGLREVRGAVERDGELTEAAVQDFKDTFGNKENVLTRELDRLRLRTRVPENAENAAARREENKQQVLALLDRKLRLTTWRKEECDDHDRNQAEAQQAVAALPDADTLDKILRYETKLERQMHRAMAQLERLQRMRRGEAVPAPLTVEVSERS
jgi:hypothetical protein